MSSDSTQLATVNIEDPLTRSAGFLMGVLGDELYNINQEVGALREDYERIHSRFYDLEKGYLRASSDAIGLEFLVRYSKEFAQLFEEIKLFVGSIPGRSIGETSVANMYDQNGELIDIEEVFDDWRATLVLAALPHSVLQSHFTKFTYIEISTAIGAQVAQLLRPLASLRDEYFRSPRPELLREYLRLVEATERDPQYSAYAYHLSASPGYGLTAEYLNKLEELSVELEVFSLLE